MNSVVAPGSPPPEVALQGISRRTERVLLGTVLAMALVVHSGVVLSGTFQHDDYPLLYKAANEPFWRFAATPYAGHVALGFKTQLVLFLRAFGATALPHFVLSVGLHLANIYFVHSITKRLTGSAGAALGAAIVWGLASVCHGSLSWISATGQVVVTAALLGVLSDVAGFAARDEAPPRGSLACWAILMIIGSQWFGVGLVVGSSLGALVWFLLPRKRENNLAALALGGLAILLPAIYVAALSSDWTASMGLGSVTTTAKLFSSFVAHGVAHVLVGSFVKVGEVTALAYVVAIFAVLVFIAGYRRADGDRRRHLLAFGLLTLLCYGVTAAGRASILEATNFPIHGLATMERYHYLAGASLTIALAMAVCSLWPARSPITARYLLPALLAWIGLTSLLAVRRHDQAAFGGGDALQRASDRIVGLVRRSSGPTAYLQNEDFEGASLIRAMGVEKIHFPEMAAAFIIIQREDRVVGRTVRFVERDEALVRRARRDPNSRLSRILVTESEAPASFSWRPPAH